MDNPSNFLTASIPMSGKIALTEPNSPSQASMGWKVGYSHFSNEAVIKIDIKLKSSGELSEKNKDGHLTEVKGKLAVHPKDFVAQLGLKPDEARMLMPIKGAIDGELKKMVKTIHGVRFEAEFKAELGLKMSSEEYRKNLDAVKKLIGSYSASAQAGLDKRAMN